MAQTSQNEKASPRVVERRAGDNAPRAAMSAAGVAAAAAVCGLLALGMDVVGPTEGPAPAPGVGVAAVVSVAPVVAVALIAVLAGRSRPALSGAITAGYGAIAVGLTVLDLGLLLSPIDSNRLELFRPTTAEVLDPGLGAYVIVASHALAVVGGMFGLRAVDRASFGDGYGHSPRADAVGRASAFRVGAVLSVSAVAAVLVAAACTFAAPYTSVDSVVLVPAVVEAPLTTSIGSALVALAAVVVIASALASVSPLVAAGAGLGAGLGLLGLFGARVVAGSASAAGVGVSAGSVLGTAAALVLVVVGFLALPASSLRDRRGVGGVGVNRPGSAKSGHPMGWHVVAGVCGAVGGVFLGAGGLLPILDVPDGIPNPTILAGRVAVVAAVVLVVLSVPMFFSLFAAAVRPALGVMTVAGVMAGAGVLQSVVLATDIDGIALGAGGVAVIVGVMVSAVCGGAVLLAGGSERDDVDTSDSDLHVPTFTVASVGAVLATVGLTLPLYRGGDAAAASAFQLPWGWDVWGQAALAVTLLISAVVAGRSRPARGAALLGGATAAMIVYLLGWPLTAQRVVDPTVGPGVVVGAVGAVVLAVAALVSARRRSR